MKKLQKIILALLSAGLIALGTAIFVSCSNDSSDDSTSSAQSSNGSGQNTNNSSGNNSGNQNTNTYFFAEAVSGGIKLTIKTLPTQFRNYDWIGIYDDKGACIVPEWSDKTQDWTGLYPFISSGETRTFKLCTTFTIEETLTVTATGGTGSFPDTSNLTASLTIESDKITVGVPSGYSPSLLPENATDKELKFEICTEDGTSFGYGAITDLSSTPTSYEFTGNNFNDIKNDWKQNYSDKKIYADVFYEFNLPDYNDIYRLNVISSENKTPTAWQN
ncbi:hypothetical protein MSI_9930 [Treponema sp. JC4]|uniref:hypothetical protein n=1 Tax=Treponema sp. JC4 TaxID=1124982 RepID=UPI00025B06F8|nr:hypothetical protein [Treponema sp. JC4]EID85560.1 hypothetical protein MSI_9930 [Treponema sp. JC4]